MSYVLLFFILNDKVYFETMESVLTCEIRKVEIRKQNPQVSPVCMVITERVAHG
jgi:uncharacterized membrane protein